MLESLSLGAPFIAVNLNYRLNLFGFAASSELLDDQTSGQRKGCNFGLHDQQIGIQWVSRNISYFSGDPTKITLGGQSAGAASTHTHTLAAKQKPETPLFRRSIFQSGSLGCLGPSPLSEANERWEKICRHFGFEKDGPISRPERLRTLPTGELMRAQKELGWISFPVIIDSASFMATDAGCEVLIDLDSGRGSRKNAKSSREAIEVLLGDTDAEVKFPSIIKVASTFCVQSLTLHVSVKRICCRKNQQAHLLRASPIRLSRSFSNTVSCRRYPDHVWNNSRESSVCYTRPTLALRRRCHVRPSSLQSSEVLRFHTTRG